MEKPVYIIDDDPVYLRFMMEHFKLLGGYQTEVYENGDKAIQRIDEQRPYLVILDNHLKEPNKSGVDYLKQIKGFRPRIPVIYITAETDPKLKSQVQAIGVKAYIIKNDSFLVYLRTALDELQSKKQRKGLLGKLFG